MPNGDRWTTLAAALVIVSFAGFHLTKRWTRPTWQTVETVNAIGWGALLAMALYAIFSLQRG